MTVPLPTASVALAVGESSTILLHLPLSWVGVPIWTEREVQQNNDSPPADG